ncbi:MAG: hypothetical protein U0531_09795 [Dehalococcoidia bacterium]
MFVPVQHHLTGRRPLIAAPFQFDGVRPPVRRPAPDFGADTDAVLAALPGFDAARRAAMRQTGVTGTEPL